MKNKGSKTFDKAAEDLKTAAQHYKKAAKLQKKGKNAKAARHVDAALVKSHEAEYRITEKQESKAARPRTND
jgi:hypothetical protein